MSKALLELRNAVAEFRENYEMFVRRNQQFLDVNSDIYGPLAKAEKEEDINRSAEIFRNEISITLSTIERKRNLSRAKWTGRLGEFLAKLYPVARFSLAIVEVSTIDFRLTERVRTLFL
jgi:hypothetical protein